MKIKIKWINVILRFVKRQFFCNLCLFVKSVIAVLMPIKTSQVEGNNKNEDSIENNGYGSLEIDINDEDKNQVDKCDIEICIRTVSLEPLPLCEDIPHTTDVSCESIYDEIYTSQSEFINSFEIDILEEKNINEDSIKNNSYDSLKINNEEFLGEDEDKNQVDKCDIEICKLTISSETLPLCENIPHVSDATLGPVTVKIPVVLTECNITLTMNSSLKLEDDVLEIKHIKKNVYLNQCKLIPDYEKNEPNTGRVFIAGFIRTNIEYSTKYNNYKEVLSGILKQTSIDVPFKYTTKVTFNTPPEFKRTTFQEEVEILQTNIEVYNPYEEEITGGDIREQNFRLMEYFNEKIFCELVSAEFVESYILKNPTNKECKSPLEQTFHDITENVVLFLTIKLMQNQHVTIPK